MENIIRALQKMAEAIGQWPNKNLSITCDNANVRTSALSLKKVLEELCRLLQNGAIKLIYKLFKRLMSGNTSELSDESEMQLIALKQNFNEFLRAMCSAVSIVTATRSFNDEVSHFINFVIQQLNHINEAVDKESSLSLVFIKSVAGKFINGTKKDLKLMLCLRSINLRNGDLSKVWLCFDELHENVTSNKIQKLREMITTIDPSQFSFTFPRDFKNGFYSRKHTAEIVGMFDKKNLFQLRSIKKALTELELLETKCTPDQKLILNDLKDQVEAIQYPIQNLTVHDHWIERITTILIKTHDFLALNQPSVSFLKATPPNHNRIVSLYNQLMESLTFFKLSFTKDKLSIDSKTLSDKFFLIGMLKDFYTQQAIKIRVELLQLCSETLLSDHPFKTHLLTMLSIKFSKTVTQTEIDVAIQQKIKAVFNVDYDSSTDTILTLTN